MGECVIREKGEIWRVSRLKPRSGPHWEKGWQHALVEVTLRQVLGLGPNFLFLITCRPLWYLGISQESTFNSCLTSDVYCCLIAKLCQTLQTHGLSGQIRSDQSLSHVRLFATPWITARQASLSITNSRSSLRLTSIESVMPSSHLILSSPSPPAPNPSQHQSLFQWVNSHQKSMGFPRQEYWSGLPFLLQGPSRPKDQTHISCIADRFFTAEPQGTLKWSLFTCNARNGQHSSQKQNFLEREKEFFKVHLIHFDISQERSFAENCSVSKLCCSVRQPLPHRDQVKSFLLLQPRVVVVQSVSRIRLFVTPWTAAR